MTEQPEQTLASSATAKPPEFAEGSSAPLETVTVPAVDVTAEPAPSAPPPSALVPDTPEPAPVQNPHAATPADDGGSMYDDPAFQERRLQGIKEQIEGWERDWQGRVSEISSRTGLSRLETMIYLQLLQMGAVRGIIQGFQEFWNSDQFQDRRQEEHELTKMQHAIARLTLNIDDKGEPIEQSKVLTPQKPWRVS